MNFLLKLMRVILLNLSTTRWLWQSSHGPLSSLVCGQLLNQIIFFTTLGKRDLFHLCLEVNTLCVVTQPEKSVALHANFARLRAQHMQSRLSQSQDRMAHVERPSTTSIWQNASFAVSVKRLAQSTRLLRDQILSMQLSCTRNSSMIKRNWSRMGTSGNPNLRESWRLNSELDEQIPYI